MLIIPMMLLGIVVALIRRSSKAVVEGPRPDAPMRLLRWTTGLLSAQRAEWGQAMLGELDHIEGRLRRWRFAIGCVGAALLLPPWGRVGAGVFAMLAVAVGGARCVRLSDRPVPARRQQPDWRGDRVDLLAGLRPRRSRALAPARHRRPRTARRSVRRPGVAGGVRLHLLEPHRPSVAGMGHSGVVRRGADRHWCRSVPVRGGSAAAGRRTARLAAVSAGLGVYLYGTLAVAVLGAGGPPDDSGFSATYKINDRLGNNLIFYLALLPLVTATFGWSAAAVTARIASLARPR